MDSVKAFLAETDTTALEAVALTWGKNIIFALLIFFIGKWIANRAVKVMRRLMRRSAIDETLVGFVGNIAKAIFMGFVIIAALTKLGVNTNSLAAAIAAAGLAIGLALQGSLSNFAAGIMLIMFRPFSKGDYVQVADTAGSVEEVNIFTTKLKTPDNRVVIVPNSNITSSSITNFSAEATRRLDMVFGIGYDDDIKKAKEILETVLKSKDYILDEPAPVVAVLELGESSINIAARPWVNSSDYWKAHFELHEEIKELFDDAGLTIPFPQRDLHVYQQELLPKKSA